MYRTCDVAYLLEQALIFLYFFLVYRKKKYFKNKSFKRLEIGDTNASKPSHLLTQADMIPILKLKYETSFPCPHFDMRK